LNKKTVSLLSGITLGSTYGGIAFFTTLFKGTGLDTFFISSGIVLAPIGMALLWVVESLGLVTDPGMGGGIIIAALGGYMLWVIIFS
jgi:uncharacterized membrane protein (UPF0136 family)